MVALTSDHTAFNLPYGASKGALDRIVIAAARELDLDLADSYVIGDRWRDIDAGRAVGCFSILIDRPYSACDTADARVGQLSEAVDAIIYHAEGGRP